MLLLIANVIFHKMYCYLQIRRESFRGSRAVGRESFTVDQGFKEQTAFRRETGQDSTIPHARAIPSWSLRSQQRRIRRSREKYLTGRVLLEQQCRCARGKRRNDMFTILSCLTNRARERRLPVTTLLAYITHFFCIDCHSAFRSRVPYTWSQTVRRAGRGITSFYELPVFITGRRKRRVPRETLSVWQPLMLIRLVIMYQCMYQRY